MYSFMLKTVCKEELKRQDKWDLAKGITEGSWRGHAKDERRKLGVE
jgi:hypothetical protein